VHVYLYGSDRSDNLAGTDRSAKPTDADMFDRIVDRNVSADPDRPINLQIQTGLTNFQTQISLKKLKIQTGFDKPADTIQTIMTNMQIHTGFTYLEIQTGLANLEIGRSDRPADTDRSDKPANTDRSDIKTV
jgi:hypothetical protein